MFGDLGAFFRGLSRDVLGRICLGNFFLIFLEISTICLEISKTFPEISRNFIETSRNLQEMPRKFLDISKNCLETFYEIRRIF